jgi:hypothetical protein
MIADKRADWSATSSANGCSCAISAKVGPDILSFPDFDDNVREAFRRETELLFSYIVREPQRARAAERGLHVRQRAARAALRHSGVYGTRFGKCR